jgi:cyclic beta-1,2-glucan synthetase
LQRLVGESSAWGLLNKRSGVFILHASRMPEKDRAFLLAAAQVVLHGDAGSLARQLELAPASQALPAALSPSFEPAPSASSRNGRPLPTESAEASSSSQGGPHDDGREFVIELNGHDWTPAPWSNVIANPSFGCLVTEAGMGCTWAENSRENRLTTWSNDPVADPPSEVVYLRNEATGEFWTPTPLPIRSAMPYIVRHRAGSTHFEHRAHGIDAKLEVCVAAADPVKLVKLNVRNVAHRACTLSATYAAEWVLGVSRDQTQLSVATEVDGPSGALLATNFLSQEFGRRVACMHVVGRPFALTGDRREFLGRNGSWAKPAAMGRIGLSGRAGAGLDPFGAVQTKIELAPGEDAEIVFLLGQAACRDDVGPLLAHYDSSQKVSTAIGRTCKWWEEYLATIQVRTPAANLDRLLNHWLPYQILSCRFWGRTAFYQSGGAFGYRDQLQDAMALVYGRPDLARAHLLLAASRQFEEGDVQHWWHPPGGRGIRTRFSDDLLWLPFVAAHYIRTTRDTGVLDESAPYLRSPPLGDEEQERYELPDRSAHHGTLFDHCLRAIDRASRYGPHGLPLMGCGDWNDGMNRVGFDGKGESVWVGWFLLCVLEQFVPLAQTRGERERATTFREAASRLRDAIEREGWDGDWYLRAFFDDGTPLGSRRNDACQIDSLSQSWSVMAGADTHRARTAMQAAWDRLVRSDEKLVLLFWPPFNHTPLEPGYIKGYLPGVRENGGQYTHAAAWFMEAWALLGEGNRAGELLDMLNPFSHSDSQAAIDTYRVEPYVMAADVYSLPPHVGRGGWTWYTGSAAWIYRVALEYVLGFQLRGDILRLNPCISAAWDHFEIEYRRRSTTYHVVVDNPDHTQSGVGRVSFDGKPCANGEAPLPDDGGVHEIRVVMGCRN